MHWQMFPAMEHVKFSSAHDEVHWIVTLIISVMKSAKQIIGAYKRYRFNIETIFYIILTAMFLLFSASHYGASREAAYRAALIRAHARRAHQLYLPHLHANPYYKH